MKKLAFIIILLAIVGCKKDSQDNDPIDPIVKDTTITYPEKVIGVRNLLKLASGTEVKPDTTYSTSAILGKDATLKVILNDPSSTAITNWNIVEGSNSGWTVSAYENGYQELTASDTGLIDLRIKFSNTGICNIQKFENQLEVSNDNIHLQWVTVVIPPTKFILAGYIDSLNYHFYDFLVRPEEELYLDVNQDGLNDLYLNSLYDHWNGGSNTSCEPYIKSVGIFEILADSSMKSYTYREKKTVWDVTLLDTIKSLYKKIDMPKILEYNDTINRYGTWISSSNLTFSYKSSNVYMHDDTVVSTTSDFRGWNEIGYKYLGYRYITEEDTLYGWLKLDNEIHYFLHINETSYK